ncbi:hypothetical protein [Leifsonia xyli]|uniref:hypothetical protein n=1 Tax=Leifsonia xyli TaxID=1575 RepID=UPI003D66EE36
MSVPALSGPAPQSPGTPQKTITQLLTQWADLTNAAIAATGHTDGWKDDTPLDKSKPWDPAAEDVHLGPCGTVGSKMAHQVQAAVYHAAFEPDPHPIADKLTAYWESQGFTVTRTVDWTDPTGEQSVLLRATRPDGVYYGLDASTDLIAIDVSTECSAHPSIQAWAREGSLRDLNAPSPTPTPSANLGEGAADAPTHAAPAATSDPTDPFREFHDDAGNHAAPAAANDSTDLFREFHDDTENHAGPAAANDSTDLFREFFDDTADPDTPAAASDPADLFREFHDDADNDSSPPTTDRPANDYNWMW